MTRPLAITLVEMHQPFTGLDLRERGLGGVETATVLLAEALAARGHRVTAVTMTDRRIEHEGVVWQSSGEAPSSADLAIAGRAPRLFGEQPRTRARALWLHGPAGYLAKPRHAWPLLRYRPSIVTLGAYHAASVPAWLPRRRLLTIPLAVDPLFRRPTPRIAPPAPTIVFASNPRRGLGRLLDLWRERIHAARPDARFLVVGGAQVYGGGDAKADALLAAARATPGVTVIPPQTKAQLAALWEDARLMLYAGDPGETFCLAAAEAQAAGVPLVTQGIGALAERLTDDVNGRLCQDEAMMAEATLAILNDDGLWQRLAEGARTTAQASWDSIAARFEALAA